MLESKIVHTDYQIKIQHFRMLCTKYIYHILVDNIASILPCDKSLSCV